MVSEENFVFSRSAAIKHRRTLLRQVSLQLLFDLALRHLFINMKRNNIKKSCNKYSIE